MKKYFLGFCVFIYGCVTEMQEIVSVNEICFSLSELTRGTPINYENELSSMAVFAFNQGTIYLEDRHLVRVDNMWSFSPREYYPSTGELDFIAYSPYANSDNGLEVLQCTDSELILSYSVPSDVALQPDLMISDFASGSKGEVVNLSLTHTLAAISFSVSGSSDATISSVGVKNISVSGVLSFNGQDFEWQTDDESSDEFYSGISQNITITDTSTSLMQTDGYLMMLPQTLSSDAQLVVTMSTGEDYVLSFEQGSKWSAGEKYNYELVFNSTPLIDPLPTIPYNGDYTSMPSSNCYILNPTSSLREYYIPVEDRVNEFWWNGGYEQDRTKRLRNNNRENWSAQILWSDVSFLAGFSAENVSSGYSSSDVGSAMKVTLPADFNHGNIVVAVVLDDVILWSWHFWVTDYFPYNCSPSEENKYFVPENQVGTVAKYGGSMWDEGASYEHKYVMDRNIGALTNEYIANAGQGVLLYQFGRKDPFPGYGAKFEDYTDTGGVVWNNATFYAQTLTSSSLTVGEAVQCPVYYSTSSSWINDSGGIYEFSDSELKVWADPYVSVASDEKSIFDPSPLMWKVPNYMVWEDFDDTDDYLYNFLWDSTAYGRYYAANSTSESMANVTNYSAFYPVQGYLQTTTGSLFNFASYGVYWSSTPESYYQASTMLITSSTVSLYYNSCSYGFSVRSVME
ncbi:MAG: fimbrillin family protein [Rikenellaceae bacterium]